MMVLLELVWCIIIISTMSTNLSKLLSKVTSLKISCDDTTGSYVKKIKLGMADLTNAACVDVNAIEFVADASGSEIEKTLKVDIVI